MPAGSPLAAVGIGGLAYAAPGLAAALGAAASPKLGGVLARTARDVARLASPATGVAGWMLDAGAVRPAMMRALVDALQGQPVAVAGDEPPPPPRNPSLNPRCSRQRRRRRRAE